MSRNIIFNGPDGKLEGRYSPSKGDRSPAVLVLHPHPLHGGTMNNRIVHRTYETFIKHGFSALKFNFRGVGKSQGVFDKGVGEMSDAAAALDWLQKENPEASSYWVAGFSFGAWIALQLIMRRPEVKYWIAIAPPAATYEFLAPCPSAGLIVQGTEDTISPEDQTYGLYERLSKQRKADVEYIAIDGANHFFVDKIDEFCGGLDSYIVPRMKEQDEISTTLKQDKKRLQVLDEE
jgi:alpha/beta superfamily hydrolase